MLPPFDGRPVVLDKVFEGGGCVLLHVTVDVRGEIVGGVCWFDLRLKTVIVTHYGFNLAYSTIHMFINSPLVCKCHKYDDSDDCKNNARDLSTIERAILYACSPARSLHIACRARTFGK